MKTTITISKESYWKLMEIKVELRAMTWDELIDKIYKMVVKQSKNKK